MSQKTLFFIFFFFTFSLVSISSAHSAATVFGPNELTVNTWHYHCSHHAFTVDTAGKGELTLTKLTPGKKIRGGFIIYNYQIIPLKKFFQGNPKIQTREIKLRTKNRFFVFLRGKPGATISVEIREKRSTYPPEAQLSVDPDSISQGESCTLTWSTSHADLATIAPEIGAVGLSGTINVSPNKTTKYTLTAKGVEGTVTAQAEVKVILPKPTVTITATPDTIAPGNRSSLTWNSEHAVSCTIEPDVGTVAVNGTVDVIPTKTTIYTITAVGSGGTSRAQVLVQLYPIKIQRFDKSQAHYITPENTVAAGSSALLQHDLEWFHETFTEEAVAFEKKLYAESGIDPESSFGLIDENDEEYILDKKPDKDGLLVIIEKKSNDIDGTILTTSAVLVLEKNLWKATFEYNGDEELNQYDDIKYTDCIANYSFTPNFLDDSSWHNNDLTNYNKTAGALDQRYGKDLTVAELNGINNGFSREPLNDMPRDKFSMGGWIKADSVDHTARILEIGRDRNDSTAIVLNPGKGLRYWVHVGGKRIERTAAMDYDFHDNQWHHIYLTYNGVAMKLYVDGQLKDSHPVSGTIDSASVLNIGQHNGAVYSGTSDSFKGRLDDIQIYNKALTLEQIMKKYENGTTQPL